MVARGATEMSWARVLGLSPIPAQRPGGTISLAGPRAWPGLAARLLSVQLLCPEGHPPRVISGSTPLKVTEMGPTVIHPRLSTLTVNCDLAIVPSSLGTCLHGSSANSSS